MRTSAKSKFMRTSSSIPTLSSRRDSRQSAKGDRKSRRVMNGSVTKAHDLNNESDEERAMIQRLKHDEGESLESSRSKKRIHESPSKRSYRPSSSTRSVSSSRTQERNARTNNSSEKQFFSLRSCFVRDGSKSRRTVSSRAGGGNRATAARMSYNASPRRESKPQIPRIIHATVLPDDDFSHLDREQSLLGDEEELEEAMYMSQHHPNNMHDVFSSDISSITRISQESRFSEQSFFDEADIAAIRALSNNKENIPQFGMSKGEQSQSDGLNAKESSVLQGCVNVQVQEDMMAPPHELALHSPDSLKNLTSSRSSDRNNNDEIVNRLLGVLGMMSNVKKSDNTSTPSNTLMDLDKENSHGPKSSHSHPRTDDFDSPPIPKRVAPCPVRDNMSISSTSDDTVTVEMILLETPPKSTAVTTPPNNSHIRDMAIGKSQPSTTLQDTRLAKHKSGFSPRTPPRHSSLFSPSRSTQIHHLL